MHFLREGPSRLGGVFLPLCWLTGSDTWGQSSQFKSPSSSAGHRGHGFYSSVSQQNCENICDTTEKTQRVETWDFFFFFFDLVHLIPLQRNKLHQENSTKTSRTHSEKIRTDQNLDEDD